MNRLRPPTVLACGCFYAAPFSVQPVGSGSVHFAEGGGSYHVLLLDGSNERMLVKPVHGPYQSR